MKPGSKGKRVSIVFTEDGGDAFNMRLEGLTPRRTAEINSMDPEERAEHLSPAEFYAVHMLRVCAEKMHEIGALRSFSRDTGKDN